MLGIIHYFVSHFQTLGTEFWPLLIGGLANGLIYAMVAIGYTLVYGVLRLINFAHSEIFMSGAFGAYFVLRTVVGASLPNGISSLLLIALGMLAGAVVGAIVAVAVERVAYRPLRKRNAPKLAYLISAIGASYFLFNMAGKEFGRYNTSLPEIFVNHPLFSIFGAQVQMYYVVVAVAGMAMLIGLDRAVSKSMLGRSIRAVAQDAETASLMGVNIDRTIILTFLIGGALGGAGGFLWAISPAGGVSATMGFTPALKAFTAAVLGGIGNIRGAVLGGVILGVVESLSVAFISGAYTDVAAFAILVLVLLFRPTGILGERLGRSA